MQIEILLRVRLDSETSDLRVRVERWIVLRIRCNSTYLHFRSGPGAEGVWVMTSKCLGHNSMYSPIRTTIRTIAIVCIGEYTLLANTYYCDPQPPGPDRKCEYVLLHRIRSTIHLSTLTLKSEVSLSSLTLSKILA